MPIDRSQPATWAHIERDPTLKHLAENPAFYDGDVHGDLELMRACGVTLCREFPGVRLDLRFEDDGTMHMDVQAPGRKPADVFVLDGRYLVYLALGRPDESMEEAKTPADVVRALSLA